MNTLSAISTETVVDHDDNELEGLDVADLPDTIPNLLPHTSFIRRRLYGSMCAMTCAMMAYIQWVNPNIGVGLPAALAMLAGLKNIRNIDSNAIEAMAQITDWHTQYPMQVESLLYTYATERGERASGARYALQQLSLPAERPMLILVSTDHVDSAF